VGKKISGTPAERRAVHHPPRLQRDLGGGLQALDARAVLTPSRDPFFPAPSFFRRVGALRDPRREVLGREPRKCEQHVPEVALRIDDDRWNAVDRGLFEERDREPGLAAPGHADDDGVGRQVARVVEKRPAGRLRRHRTAEIERTELFEFAGICRGFHPAPVYHRKDPR